MNTKENAVSKLSTGLKHETVAYRIFGIVMLALAAITILSGIFILLADTSVHTLGFGNDSNYLVLGYGFVVLAIAIVNLIRSSKISKYRLDEALTVKHAGSVSSIVISALFNEVALVFSIINFVTSKTNKALLSE